MTFKIFEDDDMRYKIIGQILAQTVKKGEDKILDLGCREAKLSIPYAVTNNILGIDIDIKSIKIAKQYGIHALLCDNEKITFQSNI
ncbi:MAG: hypothetical protein ACFFDN_38015 [Candidatus Hodarchaeota archaeon]